MPNMEDIDSHYIKQVLLNAFNQAGLREEDFFNLVRRNPNINKLDDLIAAITAEDKSKKNETIIYPDVIEVFKKYNGIVTATILKKNHINYYQLNKLEEMGMIIKLKRGLYALKDIRYIIDEIVEAALFVPKGVLCLYSALAHHELTTYTPSEYNFAISRKERKPSLPDYPPIRLFSYDDDTFDMGIETIDKEGHVIRIYDLERTICDIVKYRNKLDANVVKESLNNYSSSRKRNYAKLLKYAGKMRVKSILTNYLEVL
ncbi:Abortive infection protein AbiEi [Paenibacillus doosanensis]|uniref:Transcriptional regulator n=1 Tax=Paenibacillus konkukensis TaxID=2020716 RepID=A0ABY4RN66_9BACL|nr:MULTISPECIES: Abortive infection protein AbiEi [Paenibacillus]MCS7462998.1 Abortive infection protein AbiEi [Paenibacillus doosanensis]UQZ83904.1 hypothetical protein SK3146_03111 [Paenibacillus konkukensis]